MGRSELTEEFETGLFRHPNGRVFIRCEFNPEEPVWIDVSGDSWSATYGGTQQVFDWSKIDASPKLISSLQDILKDRLRTNSPFYLSRCGLSLRKFFRISTDMGLVLGDSFALLDTPSFLEIWSNLTSFDRSLIRSIYVECAEKNIAGADYGLAQEIKDWKARNDVVQLRDVVQWNPEQGAFTSAEWEIVRGFLEKWNPDEHPHIIASKIFGRIMTETLKRPSQIWAMPKNALWEVPSSDGPNEYFLRIPKAKFQTGARPGVWQITESLGRAIKEYSQIPAIRILQERVNRLAVLPGRQGTPRWVQHGQVDSHSGRTCLRTLVRNARLISPRTGEVINLTPYRIRHTGGTAMALQGIPREQIQEILEHDSPFTCDAYIQAVGSDLVPALEKATDRGVGEVFAILSEAYFFKGTITADIGKKAITIPTVNLHEPSVDAPPMPAVVGGCRKQGACTKHPFWACYNGCPYFLAWKDADHRKSLDYVESELTRWGKAEGGRERSKLSKDFDRIAASIQEVVQQVEAVKGDAAE
ncbi:site-specific integrase [Marinobacter sp.]|uniref:site-specific integrase n=2 Tax=Marinobacter sp. TaxID=50741 RepID=UPI0035C6AAE3